jgi:hypothetical protein
LWYDEVANLRQRDISPKNVSALQNEAPADRDGKHAELNATLPAAIHYTLPINNK